MDGQRIEAGQDRLSYEVIGLAMEVHRELGPGLAEEFYHQLPSRKLSASGIEHRSKHRERLTHRGQVADEFEADLIVREQLVLELKHLTGGFALDHYTQLICYLKFWGIRTGWLIDFGKESLTRRRIVYDTPPVPPLDTATVLEQSPPHFKDEALLLTLHRSVDRACQTHGLGYRDTSYVGLLMADLRAEGIPFGGRPSTSIIADEEELGRATLNCLTVNDACAFMILALRDGIRAADRAIMQSYLRHLHLPWGIIVNFGKRQLDMRFVLHPKSEKPILDHSWSS